MVIDGLNIYEQEYGKKFVANEYEHQDLINERIEDLANAAIRRNFDVRLKFQENGNLSKKLISRDLHL